MGIIAITLHQKAEVALYLIIFTKFFLCIIYTYINPYLKVVSNFFKVAQEILFIILAGFYLNIEYINKDLNDP
jgi:cytochrome c oxidase subunit IV